MAESVPPLRRAVRRFARRRGASPTVQARVALAFSEVCVLLLGPADGPDRDRGQLIVEARGTDDDLTIRVADSRRGLVPRIGHARQGFELALLTQACDRVSIEHRREGSGMAVTLTFALAGADRSTDPPRAGRVVTAP